MIARRLLYHLPIIHTDADLGSLAPSLRARLPESELAARRDAIDRFWDRTAAWLESIHILQRGQPLRIYQDGLPVIATPGVSESRLVADLAAQGSRNHQLLLLLESRGAVLMGTESAELLVREYELAKAALDGRALQDPRRESRARAILELRDRFIAERINATLPAGAAAVLLLGALHDPSPWLAPDIELQHPLGPRPTLHDRKGQPHAQPAH